MLGGYRSRRLVSHLWRSLLLGFALGLALFLVGIAPIGAQEQGGAMAVDCEGNSAELDTECRFGEGQEFTVAIQVVEPPPAQFAGVQAKLRWDGDVLEYQPTQNEQEEVAWPDCTLAVRADPGETELVVACAAFSAGMEAIDTSYTGAVYLFSFLCTGQGESRLMLVPRSSEDLAGSHFVDPDGRELDTPSLGGATVTCGGSTVSRPEPEVTPREEGEGFITEEGTAVPPEEEPPPDEQPPAPDEEPPAAETTTPAGPAATPGGPTVVDGRVGEGAAQGDDDGDGIGAWVWLLVGVAAVAAAGGLSFLAWRRRGAGREGA